MFAHQEACLVNAIENRMSYKENLEKIRIGTRGSELALVQADTTEELFRAHFPQIEIIRSIIKTTGDRRTDVSLADVAKAEGTFDKGVFIKELEEALADGSVDIAVHSLKDMPTVVDSRFVLASTLERAPVADVLLMKHPGGMHALPQGAKVGTSSVRRAHQMKFLRPDLSIIDLRGNVPTRISKLAVEEQYDAILLAEAGLIRLGYLSGNPSAELEMLNGYPEIYVERLPQDVFYPAAGQGAIGLEVRADDAVSYEKAKAICHEETWKKVTAEREFLRLLEGGCHTPVGVYSTLQADGTLALFARVFPEDGTLPQIGQAVGADPILVAKELFESLS